MQDDVEYGKIIYERDDTVKVYQGFLKSSKEKVCIKVLYSDTLNEANEILQESYNLMRFKDIPNIVKIYKSDFSQTENRYFIRVVMQYFEKGDLKKLIKSRLSTNYWTEKELLAYLFQLVSVFAQLQDKGVAHRDIKPENIFVSDDTKVLIVGDLGNASEKNNSRSQTIAGTPMYLSPEIRKAYSETLIGYNPINFQYNPFKSDVYSLGLTFLYMASLRDFATYTSLRDYGIEIPKRIEEIRGAYPKLYDALNYMLAFNENDRPDFKSLLKKLGALCYACGNYSSNFNVINEENVCSSCINEKKSMLWDFPYWCATCNNFLKQGYCEKCRISVKCQFCKLDQHSNPCISATIMYPNSTNLPCFFCAKDQFYGEPYNGTLHGYYFTCKRNPEHRYCVVCNKGDYESHTVCALWFQDKNRNSSN
ncbi:hypothetical protein SteCoe_28854 [Stentor coeruleus]|uniref:Protein kinase domain-containing protein n=1 Tax=Stentor coeruleus TaxID=5963 RepID=A0A1R2B7B7_9CILI|nr:hypothetical protein SteCoe_28854 [Stentor coeruleus]